MGGATCMTSMSPIKRIPRGVPAATRPRPRWAVALTLAAGIGYGAVVALIDPCGWYRANAQAPTGHRQPTAADVPKDSSQKDVTAPPANAAMERALNNVCRGCSPMVPVGSVPRYDVALTCGRQDRTACVRDEEAARDQLNKQWAQFTPAGRSNCIQTAQIGGRPSYVELIICLKATQIAPTLPDAR
jgi:hypothetical protein